MTNCDDVLGALDSRHLYYHCIPIVSCYAGDIQSFNNESLFFFSCLHWRRELIDDLNRLRDSQLGDY